MIARLWKGWTQPANADAYEALLHSRVLPGLRGLQGHQGGYVLRRDGPEETEFAVVNFFDPLEAVQTFAGPDHATPVFEPEARALLARFESKALHYDVKATPEG